MTPKTQLVTRSPSAATYSVASPDSSPRRRRLQNVVDNRLQEQRGAIPHYALAAAVAHTDEFERSENNLYVTDGNRAHYAMCLRAAGITAHEAYELAYDERPPEGADFGAWQMAYRGRK